MQNFACVLTYVSWFKTRKGILATNDGSEFADTECSSMTNITNS